MTAECSVCFRKCRIGEGKTGFCGARGCIGSRIVPLNYGKITALALDPVEKKPLRKFFPGSKILSVGSFGCNLRCPFCQNSDISWSEHIEEYKNTARTATPEQLVNLALSCRDEGNIGIAFTYNEPLIGYEFVRDTSLLLHKNGLKSVMVTNGTASAEILGELSHCVDAMNIDLKGFSENYCNRVLGGNLSMVREFIAESVKHCHVELTTLIVPGENDRDEEIKRMAEWIASLRDSGGNEIGMIIPLHITRFFPRFHMTDRNATDIDLIYRLADLCREYLNFVYTGNC